MNNLDLELVNKLKGGRVFFLIEGIFSSLGVLTWFVILIGDALAWTTTGEDIVMDCAYLINFIVACVLGWVMFGKTTGHINNLVTQRNKQTTYNYLANYKVGGGIALSIFFGWILLGGYIFINTAASLYRTQISSVSPIANNYGNEPMQQQPMQQSTPVEVQAPNSLYND